MSGMALTTVTVHGEILNPDGLTPASGTVQFVIAHKLNDVVDNIVYGPVTYTATLDVNGEFTIVLPATDNPDITPVNWVYKIFINTTTWVNDFFAQLPFTPGVTEFADLIAVDFDPCTGTLGVIPISPSEANLFVLKTGDTMTGNLIVNANLQVAGDANVEGTLTTPLAGVSLDVAQLLTVGLSSAIISGGEFAPNADPTLIDISALTGYIVTYASSLPLSPTNPSLIHISLPAQTGVAPAFAPITWFRVNSVGALVQQATTPTPTQRRTNLIIGATVTQAGIIIVDQTLPVIPSQLGNQLVDLMEALGSFSVTGNLISPNGVNLTFQKTTGQVFARGFSQVPNFQDPHTAILAAQIPVQFRHITQVPGSAGVLTSVLDVGNYDPAGAGIVTPVGGGVNTSTNFRVYAFANNTVTEQILVEYGQNTYATLAAAVAGIGGGLFVPNPATLSGALLGWISVIRTATDLSDPAQAVFTRANKFATP